MLIASETRRPPKTRPVTLAMAKTATSRVATGQLLSESRIGRPEAGFALARGFALVPVCRPGPLVAPVAVLVVMLVPAPDSAARPPRCSSSSTLGPFIALPSPMVMSQAAVVNRHEPVAERYVPDARHNGLARV